MHLRRDWEESLEDAHEEVAFGMRLIGLVVAEHLDARIEQHDAKECQDPVEAGNDRHAGEDEDAPKDEGSQDAPEEDFVLVFPFDTEIGKQHEKDEEVVDRE